MCKINLLIVLLSISIFCRAQANDKLKDKVTDSIKSARVDEAALRFPLIRQFSFSQEVSPSGDIRSQLQGKDFFKGRLGVAKTTVNLNVPIIEHGKNLLVVGFGAAQQHFHLDDVVGYDVQHDVPDLNDNLTTLSTSISYTRRDSLFGLPVIYNLSVTGLSNPSFSRQRLTAAGLVSFTFIQNKNTALMAGLVGLIDPSSPVPAFLYLSYYHRFRSAGIELMANLPSRIAVRKELSKKVSMSTFSELTGNNFFLDLNDPNLPHKAIYSSLVIKSGLMLEYRFSRKAVLSFSGGLQSTPSSRIIENGATSNDYFVKNSNGMVPYLQVGISLLPFFKLSK